MNKHKLDEVSLLRDYLVPMFSKHRLGERKSGNVSIDIAHGVEAFDDCAVIDIGDVSVVVGTDFVRGTEFALFQKKEMDYHDLGYFLAVANISDVAAMGAIPFALLTVIRYTESMSEADFEQILRGINDAAIEYNTPVIGGDTGGAREPVLSATALGFCRKGTYLLRKNVEPDQVICVTGTVGRAFAARVYFEYARSEGLKLEGRLEDELRMAWKRPKARVRESKIIRTHATACQDVSDGLKATIEQLVSAKLLGANIVEDALPIDESTRRVAEFYGIRPAQLAMSASVDFELLFTVPTWHLDSLLDEFGDRQLKVTKIGTTTNTGVCRLLCADGRVISPLPGMVWKSQFGDVIKDALKSEIHE